MNINKIIDKINNTDTRFRFYMAHRKTNNELSIVSPTTGQRLNDKIIEIVNKQLNNIMNTTQVKYNVVGKNDDTLEITDVNSYSKSINCVIKAMKQPTVKTNFNPTNVNFFIYSFNYNVTENGDTTEKHILFFRRTKNLKSLKNGFWGSVENGNFKDIDKEGLLGVDDSIDFFIFNNEVAILKHISFESILKLKNEFVTLAQKTLESKKFEEKIVNFDSLKEAALGNGSYVKRLSKLNGSNNNPTKFLDDIDKTKTVIENFNLEIEINKDNKLIYDNETQLGNFINFMQDSYYKTLIGEKFGADERR